MSARATLFAAILSATCILGAVGDSSAAVGWARVVPSSACYVDYDQTVAGGGLLDIKTAFTCPFISDAKATMANTATPHGYYATAIYVDWKTTDTGMSPTAATLSASACYMGYTQTTFGCTTPQSLSCSNNTTGCDTSINIWPTHSFSSYHYYWVNLTNVSSNTFLLGLGVEGST